MINVNGPEALRMLQKHVGDAQNVQNMSDTDCFDEENPGMSYNCLMTPDIESIPITALDMWIERSWHVRESSLSLETAERLIAPKGGCNCFRILQMFGQFCSLKSNVLISAYTFVTHWTWRAYIISMASIACCQPANKLHSELTGYYQELVGV